jgi:hypothetical protein
MPTMLAGWRNRIHVFAALAAGAALRMLFLMCWPQVSGDSFVYGNIAIHLLRQHAYSLTRYNGVTTPTLIRLPGYPFFLVAIFRVRGIENYHAAMVVQVILDLITCLLIAAFARRFISVRAGWFALWFSALCPFTANFVAAPLTETLSIFFIALALYAAGRLLTTADRRWRWIALLAFALAYEILLRPDGVLLAAAICIGLAIYPRASDRVRITRKSLRDAILVGLLAALPLVPWTARNWRVFHVFQPLAPRYANDPGESTWPGYDRWTRTWFVDYVSNAEVYWQGDDAAIDASLLPNRAFDSAAQRTRTVALISDYNQLTYITPPLDRRFADLAAERINDHRVRYYIVLPVARLADMWLRPRTEMLWIDSRWWEFSQHPGSSIFSVFYAALNLALLVAAAIGFLRRRVPWPWMLGGYVILRSALLLTLENAEPRYTLECFPVLLIAAAAAFASAGSSSSSKSS